MGIAKSIKVATTVTLLLLGVVFIASAEERFNVKVFNTTYYNKPTSWIVFDSTNGLRWSGTCANEDRNDGTGKPNTAHKILKKFKLGGYDSWRLPTVEEIRTISLTGTKDYQLRTYKWGSKTKSYQLFGFPNNAFAAFATGDSINEYLRKEYIPFSDTVVINNAGHKTYVRPVVGTMKKKSENPSQDRWTIRFHKQIENIVRADGFAAIVNGKLIPGTIDQYPLLHFCPTTALYFASLVTPDRIKNLALEENIVSNDLKVRLDSGGVYSGYNIHLWNIKGFYEYYKDFLELGKFERVGKKKEIIAKLLEAHSKYVKEYESYLQETFVLTPETNVQKLTEKAYNIDTETLSIRITDGNAIQNNRFFGNGASYYRDNLQWGDYLNWRNAKIKLPLKDAEILFTKHKNLSYTTNVYVRPVRIKNKSPRRGEGQPGFKIHAIVIHVFAGIMGDWQTDKAPEVLSIVMHDFKRGKNSSKFTKETKIVKISNSPVGSRKFNKNTKIVELSNSPVIFEELNTAKKHKEVMKKVLDLNEILIGSWRDSIEFTYIFRKDGTGNMSYKGRRKIPLTWRVKGDQLIMKFKKNSIFFRVSIINNNNLTWQEKQRAVHSVKRIKDTNLTSQ